MDWSQSCVFLILHTNQKEGNPQGPGAHMNRKHHQMTKTPKKVSRNSGGCWKFTSPASLWSSVGSQGVGWDKQTTQKPTGPLEAHGAVAGRFLPRPWTSESSEGWPCSSPSPGCQRPDRATACRCWGHRSCCERTAQLPSVRAVSCTDRMPRGWVKVETAPQPAVCGLLTTIVPPETRNRHVLTSAPAVEGALHAYVRLSNCWPRVSTPSPACAPRRSRPGRRPPCHATQCSRVDVSQVAGAVLPQCIASELGGLGNG